MTGIPQFELAEGVDASGVTTKMLTCNCSMDLVIDNKSKLFGLHIQPPFMALSFGNLPFAITQVSTLFMLSTLNHLHHLYLQRTDRTNYINANGTMLLLCFSLCAFCSISLVNIILQVWTKDTMQLKLSHNLILQLNESF